MLPDAHAPHALSGGEHGARLRGLAAPADRLERGLGRRVGLGVEAGTGARARARQWWPRRACSGGGRTADRPAAGGARHASELQRLIELAENANLAARAKDTEDGRLPAYGECDAILQWEAPLHYVTSNELGRIASGVENGWLGGSVITNVIELLIRRYAEVCPPASGQWADVVVSPRQVVVTSRQKQRVDLLHNALEGRAGGRVFTPFHVDGCHWALAVVDFGRRRIDFADSLGGRHSRPEFVDLLARMRELHGLVLGSWPPPASVSGGTRVLVAPCAAGEWTVTSWSDVAEIQGNGSDCGVFVLMHAAAALLGTGWRCASAEHVVNFRLRALLALVFNELPP